MGHFYETTFRFPSQKTADASFPCLWTSFCTERLHAPGCPPRAAVALNPFFPDKVPFPAFGLCCCTILLALRSESPRSGFARRPAPSSPRMWCASTVVQEAAAISSLLRHRRNDCAQNHDRNRNRMGPRCSAGILRPDKHKGH